MARRRLPSIDCYEFKGFAFISTDKGCWGSPGPFSLQEAVYYSENFCCCSELATHIDLQKGTEWSLSFTMLWSGWTSGWASHNWWNEWEHVSEFTSITSVPLIHRSWHTQLWYLEQNIAQCNLRMHTILVIIVEVFSEQWHFRLTSESFVSYGQEYRPSTTSLG